MFPRSFIRNTRLGSNIYLEYQVSLLNLRPSEYIIRRTFSMSSNGHKSSRPIGKKLVVACDGKLE
jgi:hypothetical protein